MTGAACNIGAVLAATAASLAAGPAGTALAAPAPAHRPAASAAAPGAFAPAGPLVTPRHGTPFTPAQGDWEGTTRGFAASFELHYDAASGRYALTRLVLLRPLACPGAAARHSEFFLRAPGRVPFGRFGSLRFGGAGVGAQLTARRGATLTSTYRNRACAGTLTWHMRPARRTAVDDGTWTVRYGTAAPVRFSIGSGGRLIRGLPLPPVPAGCSGLRGAFDLFIDGSGRATTSQNGATVALRFRRRTATGTFRVAGCAAGSVPIRASALG